MTSAAITELYRYPIKGLSPEALTQAALQPGKTVSGDRSYAIENGPVGFDPSAPKFFPKFNFLMLMKNERLAALRTHFDDANQTLSINDGGRIVAAGNLATEEGRAAIETFFAENFSAELRGAAENPVIARLQLLRPRRAGDLDYQPRQRCISRRRHRTSRPSVALSRQPACDGLGRLA